MSADGDPMRSHELVCMVPVRNGAADLPGYFESVSHFADGVVALDDGSTDATREVLEAEPLVERILSNPRRETYEGWDDAGNRSRLLEAAAGLRPRWLLFLDADERIPPDDARALRHFLRTEALPGVAYGFRVHRMVDGLASYDRCSLWVYRLFAHRDGQSLPAARLHGVPVPEQIPRERWIRTTIRIQHLSSLDESRRAARYRKYREADPENRFQRSYRHLLDAPGYRRPWVPRVPDEPAVKETARHRRLALQIAHRSTREETPTGAPPTLSAIVIAQNDRARIGAALEALLAQEVSEPIEIILVDSGRDGTAELVRERHPRVRVVHLPEPALPGRARNAGLKIARARYVSFPGSHVVVSPGALQQRIDAHASGAAMVTGSVLNGTPTLSGWASYFLDHSEALPGRPSSPLAGSPSHCSYLTEALVEVGGFPEDRRVGEDTVVNAELFRRGHPAVRASRIRFVHKSPCRTPVRLARHHFQRGRGFGRILWERSEEGRRLGARLQTLAWLLGVYPFRRLRLVTRNVLRWGGPLRGPWLASLPLQGLGILGAALGATTFLLRPRPSLLAPIEQGRRRAAARDRPAVGPGVTVPTLFYVVPFAERDAMRAYVERWGAAPGSRMEYVFLEDLPHTGELASGTYVFAGVERMSPAQRALACSVAWDLSKAAERTRILNDPRRIPPGAELLERLREAGLAEPCTAAGVPSRGRRYSALRVGDQILPHDLSGCRHGRGEEARASSEELEWERQAFLDGGAHEGPLRALCEAAGIDFGRIDYRLRGDRIEVWDVCTNPTLDRMYARVTLALESIDAIADSLAPVRIAIDPDLRKACDRETRAAGRRPGIRAALGLAGRLGPEGRPR